MSELTKKQKILEVKNLNVKFKVVNGSVHSSRGVNIEVYQNETVGIVGESGCGKTVLSKSLMGLLDKNGEITEGEINLYNKETETFDDISKFEGDMFTTVRGKRISMIFQEPMSSLNPLMFIGEQVREAVVIAQGIEDREQSKAIAIEALKSAGIDNAEERYEKYPFEFSGGLRQRVVIAIAIACKSDIIIADEPTTALDVTTQFQILEKLKDLQKELGFSIILISHDLGVVAKMADRVYVMYAGQVVEQGEVNDIFYNPAHPYTWSLLSSLPDLQESKERLFQLEGTPPNLGEEIIGDSFAPRNKFALDIDFVKEPPMFKVPNSSENHYAKTWLLDERAPKVTPPDVILKLNEKKRG